MLPISISMSTVKAMPFPKITSIDHALRMAKGFEKAARKMDGMKTPPENILKLCFEIAQTLQAVARLQDTGSASQKMESLRFRKLLEKELAPLADITFRLPRDHEIVIPLLGHIDRLALFMKTIK